MDHIQNDDEYKKSHHVGPDDGKKLTLSPGHAPGGIKIRLIVQQQKQGHYDEQIGIV